MKKVFSLLGFFLLITHGLFSQELYNDSTKSDIPEGTDKVILDRLDFLANSTDDELDYTVILENMMFYRRHPINLNAARKEQLLSLNLLDELQVTNLFEHIRKYGTLINIYELQAIDGWDLQSIQLVLPFVIVNADINQLNASYKEILKNGEHSFFSRIQFTPEQVKGYTAPDPKSTSINSRYLGDPYKLFERYRFSYGNRISVGFTLEKDPGEEFFKGNNKPETWYQPYTGFDYYSAHIFVRTNGIIKTIAIGDFQTLFGQGLILWSGFAFSKSAQVMDVKKSGMGLKPYTSVNENVFMRGAAATIGVKNLNLTVFGSSKKIDATPSSLDTLTQEVITISSLYQRGLHRTPTEVNKKDRVGQNIFGGNLSYKSRGLSFGFTAVKIMYDANYLSNPNVYNQFRLHAKEELNIGFDYSYTFRNFNFFGEEARSANGGTAYLNGMLVMLDPRVSLSVVHRYFDRSYKAVYANVFAENRAAYNERGLYLGTKIKIANFWTLVAYYDRFTFPWIKTSINAPSGGSEYLTQLSFNPSKTTNFYFRFKEKVRIVGISGAGPSIDKLSQNDRKAYRFHFGYKVSDSFSFAHRFEGVRYTKDQFSKPSLGYLIFHEVSYKHRSFAASLRYSIFDVENASSSIFTPERDVLYSNAAVVYINKGSRFYINTRFTLRRGIDLWLRYAVTFYDHLETVGSGLEESIGNTRSEVKAQIRFLLR